MVFDKKLVQISFIILVIIVVYRWFGNYYIAGGDNTLYLGVLNLDFLHVWFDKINLGKFFQNNDLIPLQLFWYSFSKIRLNGQQVQTLYFI